MIKSLLAFVLIAPSAYAVDFDRGLDLAAELTKAAEMPVPEPVAAPELAPYSSTYDVQWGDTVLGAGTITLTRTEDGCYRYESKTRPIALVRMFYGSPRELSTFCVKDGAVRPDRFEYFIEKRKDAFALDFDRAAGTLKMRKEKVETASELPPDVYDRFSVREAARLCS